MTQTTEELAREMYEQLAAIRKARKHPIMTRNFEDDLEAYLEALRVDASKSQARIGELYSEVQQWKDISTDLRASLEKASDERGDLAVQLDHANRMVEVYSEAFDGQKMRTQNALREGRQLFDSERAMRQSYEHLTDVHEHDYAKLQDALSKLARQTQTIIALHTVIIDSQNALTSLQARLRRTEQDSLGQEKELTRQILKAEALSDDRWEQLEEKQKLIVVQRKHIENLTFDLVAARKPVLKANFLTNLWGKKRTPKPLPKKTN